MKRILRPTLLIFAGILLSCYAQAQKDSVYRVALLLPFQGQYALDRLNDYSGAKDQYTATRIHLPDETMIALDFYEGLMQALEESKNKGPRIELSIYDTQNSDSVTTELLDTSESLKSQQFIIGSVSTPESRLIASYCKQHKIINIQPFTPSKSLAIDNPYHLKLAPTIDAHVDALFGSIVDSFPGSNIIIYTPDTENSIAVAKRLDSLIKDYNSKNPQRFTSVMLNAKTMLVDGKKTTAAEQLKPGKPNILFMTSFEESFVNGNLRVLYDKRGYSQIVVYGMPNWLNGDILRLDYLNDYACRISDGFMIDSTKTNGRMFALNYKADYAHEPGKFAYLGYDVMGFVFNSLNTLGLNFLDGVSTQRYPGLAYKFDISKNRKDNQVNYYENRHVNVFKIQNYQLVKIW